MRREAQVSGKDADLPAETARVTHAGSTQPVHTSRLTPHASPAFKALPPLSLYIHIPWCVKKCPYCDFNSHEVKGGSGAPFQEYVNALIADFEQTLPRVWGRRIGTVFIGGGTPSLLPGEAVDAILAGVRARLTLNPDAEITLEANPAYFDGSPRNSGLVLRIIPDDVMRGLELRKGSLDLVINDLAPDSVQGLRTSPRLQVVEAPGVDYQYLGINLRDPALADRVDGS